MNRVHWTRTEMGIVRGRVSVYVDLVLRIALRAIAFLLALLPLMSQAATSATTLAVSPSLALVNQNVTLTATVTGASPTGTITFKNGSTTLGTATLSGGSASLSTTFASTGPKLLRAAYGGDSANDTSTSSVVRLDVTLTTTTTSLASSVNPSTVGQNTTLTANVGPSGATGTVTFKQGTTTLGTATLSNGVATLNTSFSTTGSNSLTAVYAGNTSHASSTSPALTQTVNALTTTTTALTSSVNPSALNQATTLTATVSPSAATGTVTFRQGTTTLGTGTLSNGVATLSTSFNTTGTKSLTAVYAGSSSHATSTSAALTQTVNALTATTTALASSVNPSSPNQATTLTATVSPSAATGTVTFKDGTTTLGTGTLSNGVATFSSTFSTAGSKSLTAVYAGNASHATSTSAPLTQTVSVLTATATTLVSSVNPSSLNQATTLTATVTPAAATGSVTFKDGSTTLGTGTLSNGVATLSTSFASAGSKSLAAVYAGNSSHATSTSSVLIQTVNAESATTLALGATPNPATNGQSVTLSASITPATATGMVTFFDGATTLGTANLSSGVATLSTSSLALGSHSLTASYAGASGYTASSSGAVALSVVTPGTLPPPPISPTPVVNYEYDANGNPTRTVAAPDVMGFGFATSNTYDALNRLKDSTDAKNGRTQFGYDGADRTAAVTDPRNLVTQYPRNGLGDVTSLVSPDTGTANLTYDAAGNLKTRTDSRGVLSTHSYDALNRLTSIVFSQTGQTSLAYGWTYDQIGAGFSNGAGRLTSTSHPGGGATYAYDAQGRLVTETQTVSAQAGANAAAVISTVSYGYVNGRLRSITYPSGRVLTLNYSDGQVTGLALAPDSTNASTTLIDSIQYQPFGGVQGWNWQTAAGPQPHARVFDTSGRLVRYPLGDHVRDLSYDAADRVIAYTHYATAAGVAAPGLDQGFAYDELGRLTGVTTSSASWSIAYDANGNRIGLTLNATPSTYSVSATSNRLISTTQPVRVFGYDSAGNTTSDGAYTATYSLAGRMASLTKAGVTATYTVDGLGRRVRKFDSTGASSTVIFVYNQSGQLLGEYDQAGQAIREYVWMGGTPVAVFTPDPAAPGGSPIVYTIHADHLDTPRVVLDKNGAVRWRWLAEPFGTTAPETNPSNLGAFTLNLRFPGQYADQESGLFYNYFRDYDATTGRYAQSDPIGLDGGINTYSYVGGNPLSRTDPEGLFFDAAGTYGGATAAATATGTSVGVAAAGVGAAAAVGVGIGYGFNKGWEYATGQSFGGSIYDLLHPIPIPSPAQMALPPAGLGPKDKAEYSKERSAYGGVCKANIPPSGDACKDAKANRDRLKACFSMRVSFKKKWHPNDMSHVEEIENTAKSIQWLDWFIEQHCKTSCP